MEEIVLNKEFDFGSTSFSEQDIMDFARAYDPLDFHLTKEAAAKSVFKTLVASGPQAFNWFYKNKWVPAFNQSVLAGLELNHWKLIHPVYPNQKISCRAVVSLVKPNAEKTNRVVMWKFFLSNENAELVQSLEMTVLHKNES